MSIDTFPPEHAGLGSAAFTSYEEGSFTVTATGFSGTVPSGTARYVRIGKHVTLRLPQLSGTSNATTCTITGLFPPLIPAIAATVVVAIVDNGVGIIGQMIVGSDGVMTLTKIDGTGFTASGTKTLSGGMSVAYSMVA